MPLSPASSDSGNTWTASPLPIKLGGNEDGRQAGERMQVDPNKGSVIYLGSSKDGLWKSTDYGTSWKKVRNFPVSSTSGPGISFVLFDKSSGTLGNATPRIYVGILQTGSVNLYVSVNSGATWKTVANAPDRLMPQRAVLASDGMLYITYTDQPARMGSARVRSGNTIRGLVCGRPSTRPQGGRVRGTLAVDPRHPQTLVVSTLDRWRPRDEIYRSTDGGSSWTSLTDNAIWNSSSAPYAATYRPHWIGDIEIDPFNGNNAWFGTGYGFYSTTDLTDADAGKPVTFCFADKGLLEETVVTGLKCPPTGVPLLSTVGDQDGFRHDSVGVSPASGKFSPLLMDQIMLSILPHPVLSSS